MRIPTSRASTAEHPIRPRVPTQTLRVAVSLTDFVTSATESGKMTIDKEGTIEVNKIETPMRAEKAYVTMTAEAELEKKKKKSERKLTIWKYPLQYYETKIELPEGYEILSVGEQEGQVFMWVLVNPDPNARKTTHTFQIVGTGWELPESQWQGLRYIGTLQVPRGGLLKGNYVWHVFEQTPPFPDYFEATFQ